MPCSIIENCFRKSGIGSDARASDIQEIEQNEFVAPIRDHQKFAELAVLFRRMQVDSGHLNSFINFDDEIETCDVFEFESALEYQENDASNQLENEDEEDGPEGATADPKPLLSNKEAIEAMDSLKDYAVANGLQDMLKHLRLAEKHQLDHSILVRKQKPITDFFNKV